MDLWWTCADTKSPKVHALSTLGLIVAFVQILLLLHTSGSRKCLMAWIHHSDILQSSSTNLEVLCTITLPSPNPVAVFVVLPCPECQSWDHLVYSTFRSAPFTYMYVFKVLLYLSMAWEFIAFCDETSFIVYVFQLIYSITYWKTSCLLLSYTNCKKKIYLHILWGHKISIDLIKYQEA